MIAALFLIGRLGVIALVLCLFGRTETTCDQNCNQGRNCTCAKSTHA